MNKVASSKARMPSGIPYIVGNEAAERFSFYGMKTILIVFMTQYLLMGEAKSTIWQHTFVMAAYFLPLVGALISDIFWGKYKTIIRLSLFYCIGHAVLALWETQEGLAVGLALIAIGAGGIKSCVSSHVGDQFNRENSSLLERVFGYFYISINVGAFFSTLLTPYLLQKIGPSIAFGVPGVLMFIATFIFWLGRKKFIAMPPVGWQEFKREVFHPKGLKIIFKLSVVYLFVSAFWSLFDQTGSTWVLQAERSLMNKTFDLGFIKFDVLPAQVQAMNPFLIVTLTPLFSLIVYPVINRFFKLTYLRKISIGLFITVISFVIIAWIEGNIEQGMPMHVGWQLLAFLIITAAEVLVSITALEFSYTQAPNAMKSLIMGLFWLTVTVGNLVTTEVNRFILRDVQLENVSPGVKTQFKVSDFEGIEEGYKLETEKIKSLSVLTLNAEETADTTAFSGTFVIGKTDQQNKTFEILDINKQPVQTIFSDNSFSSQQIAVHKLKGSDYFYFFAYLMLGAAVLFIIVAIFYKEERFIQDHSKAIRH